MIINKYKSLYAAANLVSFESYEQPYVFYFNITNSKGNHSHYAVHTSSHNKVTVGMNS